MAGAQGKPLPEETRNRIRGATIDLYTQGNKGHRLTVKLVVDRLRKMDPDWDEEGHGASDTSVNTILQGMKEKLDAAAAQKDGLDKSWSLSSALFDTTNEADLGSAGTGSFDAQCIGELLEIQKALLQGTPIGSTSTIGEYRYWESDDLPRITLRQARWFSRVYRLLPDPDPYPEDQVYRGKIVTLSKRLVPVLNQRSRVENREFCWLLAKQYAQREQLANIFDEDDNYADLNMALQTRLEQRAENWAKGIPELERMAELLRSSQRNYLALTRDLRLVDIPEMSKTLMGKPASRSIFGEAEDIHERRFEYEYEQNILHLFISPDNTFPHRFQLSSYFVSGFMPSDRIRDLMDDPEIRDEYISEYVAKYVGVSLPDLTLAGLESRAFGDAATREIWDFAKLKSDAENQYWETQDLLRWFTLATINIPNIETPYEVVGCDGVSCHPDQDAQLQPYELTMESIVLAGNQIPPRGVTESTVRASKNHKGNAIRFLNYATEMVDHILVCKCENCLAIRQAMEIDMVTPVEVRDFLLSISDFDSGRWVEFPSSFTVDPEEWVKVEVVKGQTIDQRRDQFRESLTDIMSTCGWDEIEVDTYERRVLNPETELDGGMA